MTKSRFRSLQDPETLRQMVQTVREGIYITNSQGDILDANPAFLELLGVSSLAELRSKKVMDFIDPDTRAWEARVLERDGAIREFELSITRPDGSMRTALDTAYSWKDPETGEVLYHGILVDITLRKELENQLREQSVRDPLTGCFNRRYLQLFEGEGGTRIGSWGCIVIDIDHFKQYNDQYGHQAGDDVLVKLSRFLMRQIRAEEAVVRMGGDEFLVLLDHASAAITTGAAKRIQTAAAAESPVPFSLGWAARQGDERLEKTIGRADQKLYAVRLKARDPERRTP